MKKYFIKSETVQDKRKISR